MKKTTSRLLKTFKDIETNIMKHETPTTYEMVGAHLRFTGIDELDLRDLGVDIDDAYEIVNAAIHNDTSKVVGSYIISHYVDMFDQFKNLLRDITEGHDIWSRQHVITFPKLHCFQSIQFLVRDNQVIVVANMRSCNFKKNLPMDVFLCYYCGNVLAQVLRNIKNDCTIRLEHIIMNIGSLHIFKNEV